eukprot:CAMPEP_0196800840 /NCGR_PEP_ID=MMETSP1362-20130617/337_1 /TAXON_ID=163516 /ORGANISM="Leptocylindrus danicus, Strain CCMP1856" /LENGTH=234 /DNA_ID=CAMNT_0042171387 /DNA_START=57 /DNA_END=761 /DNA_ORIENTATION=-
MKLSAALLFLTASVGNSSEYLKLRGQKRRATVTTPVGFEDEGDIHIELPTPDMGESQVDEEDFPVPDVYSRSEEFGTLEEAGEGEDPEDDGTSDGGTGPNEPGYAPGMEPPDLDEEPAGPDPCEALGADPDPLSQAYADCMAAGGEEDPEEASASVQYAAVPAQDMHITTSEYGDESEGGDTMMKPLLPNQASKVVTKTITLEYADGTKATVMETFPELPVPTESPIGNPDPNV